MGFLFVIPIKKKKMFNSDIDSSVAKGFYFKLTLMHVINSLSCLAMMPTLVCLCALSHSYFIKNDSLLHEIYIVFTTNISPGTPIKQSY